MDKVFLVLRGTQDGIMLSGHIQFDETFLKVAAPDVQRHESGKEYRGLSRNQLCIGIACDGMNTVCFYEGTGHTSGKRTLDTFGSHIKPGSFVEHDMEKSHRILVENLRLESVEYDSKEIKELPDSENPLNRINQSCNMLQKFLRAHSGFSRDDIQDYLNLFSFIMSAPKNKHEKVEKFIERVFEKTVLLRYRG